MNLMNIMTRVLDGQVASEDTDSPQTVAQVREGPSVDTAPPLWVTEASDTVALYVSTTLRSWTTEQPDWFSRDVDIDGTCFRRLDPDYYAWLRQQMTKIKERRDTGALAEFAFEEIRQKFNAVHDWAVDHFGEDNLCAAVRGFNARAYSPPAVSRDRACIRVPARYVATPGGPFTHDVSEEAISKVDLVRERALELGWSHDSLYCNKGRFRFPFGPEYGLVCFLRPEDRIGDITERSIEIIGPNPSTKRHRYFHPGVDHPWIRHREG